MRKRELLRALEEVEPGDSITVMGSTHLVDEVAVYEKDGERWRCLVFHAHGAEFALEIEGGNLVLWSEAEHERKLAARLKGHPRFMKDPILGTKIFPSEYRQKAKMISATNRGMEELEVIYSVYKAEDGYSFAVEDWGEGIHVYSATATLPAKFVQV
ncbi:MAG: hypothetical protein HYV47_00640 [Candidatus Nealsonbacteria bacterium]|nr:hypothetical protein [Candidatus Nealsonbacteria bacterium]